MGKNLQSEIVGFLSKVGVLACLGLAGYIVYLIQDILLALVAAVAFVYLSAPLLDMLEKKRISSLFSPLIVLLGAVLVIGIAGALTFPILLREAKSLEVFARELLSTIQTHPEMVESYFSQISARYLEPVGIQMQVADVVSLVQNQAQSIMQQVLGFAKNSAGLVFSGFGSVIQGATFFGLVVLFYYFAASDRKVLAKTAVSYLPKKWSVKVGKSWKDVSEVLRVWWRGQLIEAVCMGLITAVALFILQLFGVPVMNIPSLAVLAAVSVFIPVFGPLFAMIPAVIMALHGGFLAVLLVVIVYIAIQQIEGYVLIPRIHGKSLDFGSFELIVYMLIAGSVFGIVGILFTLPVIASVRILWKHFTT